MNPKTQESFTPFFEMLDKYNKHEVDRPPVNQFGISGYPEFGVTVNIMYKLVSERAKISTGQNDSNDPTKFRGDSYIYISEISVRPDLTILILFIGIELCLLVTIVWFAIEKKPDAQKEFEDDALRTFFSEDLIDSDITTQTDRLKSILKNFHIFCIQLSRRRMKRCEINVVDEYDVQDILHALMKLHYRDVRAEEQVPSHAGATSRMDFLLRDEQIVIEVKMTRDGLKDKKLGEELLIDIARYSAHEKCKHLICFVYDPGHFIENPHGFSSDLASHSEKIKVEVVFSPP
jgi:hypothetical protein